eukprot:UN23552
MIPPGALMKYPKAALNYFKHLLELIIELHQQNIVYGNLTYETVGVRHQDDDKSDVNLIYLLDFSCSFDFTKSNMKCWCENTSGLENIALINEVQE